MKTLNKGELHDILFGAAILGTGGGGLLEEGLELIDKALSMGKEFRLVDFNEVPDDAWIAVPYSCGSVSPPDPEVEVAYAEFKRLEEPPAYLAFKALEEYLGKELYGVVSTELGACSTAEAFYVAALFGKYIIDADPAGRSVPELSQSTFGLSDLPIYPLAVASCFGDVAVFPYVVNDARAEALVRALAMASGGSVGVVDHLAKASDMKNAVIRGAISHAMRVGATYRTAVERGIPASALIAESHGGFDLFQGEVVRFDLKTIAGFTVGETEIRGVGEYEGQRYKIWFKNENLIAWRDGEVDVTAPDLICMFDDERNYPCVHPDVRQGAQVSVIGFIAPEEWRTPKGLALLGPHHFGFDIPYIPIETKHSR